MTKVWQDSSAKIDLVVETSELERLTFNRPDIQSDVVVNVDSILPNNTHDDIDFIDDDYIIDETLEEYVENEISDNEDDDDTNNNEDIVAYINSDDD